MPGPRNRTGSATLRLTKDLKELRRNPLMNISAAPVDDSNVFKWHANIRVPDDVENTDMAGIVFHFELVFPRSYPSNPPKVKVLTRIPHPNCIDGPAGGWTVCTDMLGTAKLVDSNAPYTGWSSAYSVTSVLVQISSLVLDSRDWLEDQIPACVTEAKNFDCAKCAHTFGEPVPPFPSEETCGECEVQSLVLPEVKPQPIVQYLGEMGWLGAKTQQQQPEAEKAEEAPQENDGDGWATLGGKKKSKFKKRRVRTLAAAPIVVREPIIRSDDGWQPTGPCHFVDKLKTQTTAMYHVLGFLQVKDLANLSATCKELKTATENGYLWKTVFSRHFPRKMLAGNVQKWKRAYTLESSQILQSLRCFHRKTTFQETILGIPLDYTINPKKMKLDYIYSTGELLSLEAFENDKVRKTVWGEKFMEWMPVYVSHEHFKRALPDIKDAIMRLVKHADAKWKSAYRFNPLMALDIFPPLLKTYSVLLANNGVGVSDKVLSAYCMVHRLFIALVLEFPKLRTEINKKVDRFLRVTSQRSKENCPGMGEFAVLISVCDTHSWKDLTQVIFRESITRSVLWACRKFPWLHEATLERTVKPSPQRLQRMWETTKVSRRVWLFQAYFMRTFTCGRPVIEQAAFYDKYYGLPSNASLKQFRTDVKKIMEASGIDLEDRPRDAWKAWNLHARMLGLPVKSALGWTKTMNWAVRASKRLTYTYHGMDFSKIHSSGTSRILRKGEAYTVDPNLQTVVVEDHWGWRDRRDYLDAAVMCMNAKHDMVCRADYSRTTGRHGGKILAEHSGDLMEAETKSGKHVIKIFLDIMPDDVERLVFVATVFTNDFSNIRNPYINLTDSGGNALCKHMVEELALKNGNKTAIILGELRRTFKGSKKWEFVAHGIVGHGRVPDYDDIIAQIPKCTLPKEPLEKKETDKAETESVATGKDDSATSEAPVEEQEGHGLLNEEFPGEKYLDFDPMFSHDALKPLQPPQKPYSRRHPGNKKNKGYGGKKYHKGGHSEHKGYTPANYTAVPIGSSSYSWKSPSSSKKPNKSSAGHGGGYCFKPKKANIPEPSPEPSHEPVQAEREYRPPTTVGRKMTAIRRSVAALYSRTTLAGYKCHKTNMGVALFIDQHIAQDLEHLSVTVPKNAGDLAKTLTELRKVAHAIGGKYFARDVFMDL